MACSTAAVRTRAIAESGKCVYDRRWDRLHGDGLGIIAFFGRKCYNARETPKRRGQPAIEVPTLVLASASPRRHALLGLLRQPFHVLATSTDETVVPGASVEETVISLASAKARVAVTRHPDCVVLAADTLVEMDGRILGKPTSPDEAVLMLRSLRGRWHTVWTGVAVMVGTTGYYDVTAVAASVLMRPYSDAEIAAYVATGDPMDKAAAYAVQHASFDPVAEVRGCRANVMGLPVCEVHDMLTRAALVGSVSPAHSCPVYLGIVCTGRQETGPGSARTPNISLSGASS
ncbi:MAG: Maf family protein [Chloroflexota bacterium]|nr:Maf family protein [Chloroflexota bacterium]